LSLQHHAPMRSGKCHAVKRISANGGYRRHMIGRGHAPIPSETRAKIKVYPYKVLREVVGEEISRAKMEYFKPLTARLEEHNKGRQFGWECSRSPMSKVRGQPHFRVKRFWGAMRPHIAFEHTARGLARRLTRICSPRPMAGLVELGSLDGP
jgi:hypothetical protein